MNTESVAGAVDYSHPADARFADLLDAITDRGDRRHARQLLRSAVDLVELAQGAHDHLAEFAAGNFLFAQGEQPLEDALDRLVQGQ